MFKLLIYRLRLRLLLCVRLPVRVQVLPPTPSYCIQLARLQVSEQFTFKVWPGLAPFSWETQKLTDINFIN